MRTLSLSTQIILLVIGVLWFSAIGWFVVSSSRATVLMLLIAGIFISLAFALSSFVLLKTSQPFGLPIVFSLVAICLTLDEFNHEFLRQDIVHTLAYSVALSLLFFLAIVKIWDTFEYWGE